MWKTFKELIEDAPDVAIVLLAVLLVVALVVCNSARSIYEAKMHNEASLERAPPPITRTAAWAATSAAEQMLISMINKYTGWEISC